MFYIQEDRSKSTQGAKVSDKLQVSPSDPASCHLRLSSLHLLSSPIDPCSCLRPSTPVNLLSPFSICSLGYTGKNEPSHHSCWAGNSNSCVFVRACVCGGCVYMVMFVRQPCHGNRTVLVSNSSSSSKSLFCINMKENTLCSRS